MSIAEICRSSANIFVSTIFREEERYQELNTDQLLLFSGIRCMFLTVQFMGGKMMDDMQENSLLSYVLHFFRKP